jgi:hypothetical protein
VSYTNAAEDRVQDWSVGLSTTAPTAPMKLALLTANGTESAAGTEVTGGSYARQNVTIGASASGAQANSADVVFTLMPACTVTGWALYDSAGTPFRWRYGALSANKTVNSGDTFTIPAGDLDLTLD